MRKAASSNPVSVRKGNSASEVDAYLAAVPEPARSTLNKVRAAIRSAVPKEAIEVISYQIPMFKHNGLVMGFAAFPHHCSLFVTSPSVIESFRTELKGFDTSKGTIRFPVDKPLPAALVKKLVKARLAENERRKQARGSKS